MSTPKRRTGEWMSAQQVADAFGLHVNTVKRIPPSDLPYYVVLARGDRRYKRADVTAYLESRRVSA